jgi:SPP1 gp7 family putative phage head morphogenesis protein
MKPEGWQAQRRIESDYDRAIRRLIQRSWQIIGIDPDLLSPWDLVRRLERLAGTGSFERLAVAVAKKMVTQTFSDTARTWRGAAKNGSQGRMIYEALRREMQGSVGNTVYELIDRNAGVIRSMPFDLAAQATRYIQEQTAVGKRPEQIARELLEKFPRMSAKKATLIARTEASKAHTALIQARSDRLGLAWYVWRTSQDGRVRSSHKHMEGVLCRFDTPPSPEMLAGEKNAGAYNAGEIYNCRCYPEPLIDITDVSWPHKVHYGGRIVSMSKEQFRRVAA